MSEEPTYDVEGIEGFKFDQELKFFIKWERYPRSLNSFEPLRNLKLCIPFYTYIDSLYSSLEADIELNKISMKNKLKDKIIASLSRPKRIILEELDQFDKYEFKAYQVIFHLMQPNKKFNNIFEDLFIRNYIVDLEEKQHINLTHIVVKIRQAEDIVVNIENTVDFSLPQEFNYITKNILSTIKQQDDSPEISSDSGCGRDEKLLTPFEENGDMEPALSQMQRPALLFKTNNRGWGVKTLEYIKKGSFVVECVGEILTQHELGSSMEKGFVFPFEFLFSHKSFSIDAGRFGNLSRFINHSCRPNCCLKTLNVPNPSLKNLQLVVVAITDISALDEITFDYSETKPKQHFSGKFACLCADPNCKKLI